MLNYSIKEFASALKRKTTLIYVLVIFALCIVGNTAVVAFRMIYGANEGTYGYNILNFTSWWGFPVVYCACILISMAVFGKEYPNPLIKDKNTSGLGRIGIYLGKLLASIFMLITLAVIAFVILMITTSLFQISEGFMEWKEIKGFLQKMGYAMLVWIASICIGNMFLFLFEKKVKAVVGFLIVTLVIPRTIMYFAAEPFLVAPFRFLRRYTLTQNLCLIPYKADPSRSIPLTIALSIIYAVIATIIGIVAYKKKRFD